MIETDFMQKKLPPHSGYSVIENNWLSPDQVVVDQSGEIFGRKSIQVGCLAKWSFTMFGVREDIVKMVCSNAISKINKTIDQKY